MSETYQLPDFLEFVFLLTAFFACKFCQLSPRKFYTLFLPHTFTLYNRFLSWLLPCRGGGACVPLWPLELCWREHKLQAGPPMPDKSKDRGLTKVVAGRQVRQPVFYASSAAGVGGSLSPGARQTILEKGQKRAKGPNENSGAGKCYLGPNF